MKHRKIRRGWVIAGLVALSHFAASMLVVLVFASIGFTHADGITDLEAATLLILLILLAPACFLFLWLNRADYGVLYFGLFLLNSVLWGLCVAAIAAVSRRLLARPRRASEAGDPSGPPCLGD